MERAQILPHASRAMKADAIISRPVSDEAAGGAASVVSRLLRFPLFYKVLIANALLVALGAVASTYVSLSLGHLRASTGAALALLFTVIGIALTIALNTILLRAALQPLRSLRVTVAALEQGDFEARVPQSPLADDDFANLGATLNQLIDYLQRYQERVQDLSASMLRAQEDERHRIARELHDQIGQALTLLLVRLKIIEASPQAAALEPDLADLRGAVAATIDQVRKLALDLRPPALDQLGLIPALRELVRNFTELAHIAVTFDAPAEPIVLAPERATAVYRIVQESLTNVAKHANARIVRVALAREGGAITIRIADDGCGFNAEALLKDDGHLDGPGLGLFGMEERARLIGGTLTIASAPNAGTIVAATIPLNPLETPHGTTDRSAPFWLDERASAHHAC
jgi:two-component system sensor histidine kinase UhpB